MARSAIVLGWASLSAPTKAPSCHFSASAGAEAIRVCWYDLDVERRHAELALSALHEAGGRTVTGHVGDANPLAAIQDVLHLRGFDKIILSTLPWRVSRWMRLHLPSKVRALGVPLTQVTSSAPGNLTPFCRALPRLRPQAYAARC